MDLYRSIAYFLVYSSDARAIVVAGLHTGRGIVASFLDQGNLLRFNLAIDSIWEEDINRCKRPWKGRDFVEPLEDRAKWMIVAIIKWYSL